MDYKLKAKISDKISDKAIRIGKRVRTAIGIDKNPFPFVEIWKNPFVDSRLYKVQKALNKDIKNNSSEEDIIFMSKSDYDKYTSEGYLYLSPKKHTCIGSDPEFIIFGKPIRDSKQQVVLHAADILSFDSDIGSDGHLGELRAQPGLTPKEHVNNLGNLISKIYNKLDPNIYKCRIYPYLSHDFSYLADYEEGRIEEKNRSFACGGHIHFGLSNKLKKYDSIKILIIMLDRLLTVCMHRVDMDMASKRIVETGYGSFNDHRINSNSLEYRSLSATWLLYRDLATTVLSVANSLVESISIKIAECFDDENCNWKVRLPYGYDTPNACYTVYQNIIRELFPTVAPFFDKYNNIELQDKIYNRINQDSTVIVEYINEALECLDSIIDEPKLEEFGKIVTSEYANYKKLDHDFIENWANNISVFDHLNS
ncbi:MAG: hypothetical protein GWP10_13380 [Nitrospiraceae bacterium]|nr:hypothetical protein [Nitrospiraceae bacterium]